MFPLTLDIETTIVALAEGGAFFRGKWVSRTWEMGRLTLELSDVQPDLFKCQTSGQCGVF